MGKRWCTDCDYCGDIAMVTGDGHGGKICSMCEREQEGGNDDLDRRLAEATPPQ